MAQCREVQELLKAVRRQGFDVFRAKHYKIKKDGRVVATLPVTPGGGSGAVNNIIKREKKKLIAAGFKET